MYEFLTYTDIGDSTILLTCAKEGCVWNVVALLVDFVIEDDEDESVNHKIFKEHFLADHGG